MIARFVTLGDSTAEGVGDPDGAGGHRGFANRLAEAIAAHQGSLAYANLAVSGYVAREIRARQLAPALALRPDLVAIMAGMNDLLRRRFDPRAIAGEIGAMQRAFVDTGCAVLSFTLPDVAHRLVMPPLDRVWSRRTRVLNDAIRAVSRANGALLIDLAAYDMAIDPRMWDRDRLHGSPEGHARIAAACAEAIGLPGADGTWREPLPALAPAGVRARVIENVSWGRTYFMPWFVNRLRGGPGVSQRVPKQPSLVKLVA